MCPFLSVLTLSDYTKAFYHHEYFTTYLKKMLFFCAYNLTPLRNGNIIELVKQNLYIQDKSACIKAISLCYKYYSSQ